jgi:hypothetical protein
MSKRTAVLIHGCHLAADLEGKVWEDIVWGVDENFIPSLAGRAVVGIKVANDYDAELIIFSTGASERNGFKEGEFTRTFAYELNDSTMVLSQITGFPSPTNLQTFLAKFSELDLDSQNTAEECTRNFRLCAERGIQRIILVSSPWHIQRCHTEALKVAQAMRDNGEIVPEILAIASHGSTEGIVILEPPHRGDRPKTTWHILMRQLFRIPEDRIAQAEGSLEIVLRHMVG